MGRTQQFQNQVQRIPCYFFSIASAWPASNLARETLSRQAEEYAVVLGELYPTKSHQGSLPFLPCYRRRRSIDPRLRCAKVEHRLQLPARQIPARHPLRIGARFRAALPRGRSTRADAGNRPRPSGSSPAYWPAAREGRAVNLRRAASSLSRLRHDTPSACVELSNARISRRVRPVKSRRGSRLPFERPTRRHKG